MFLPSGVPNLFSSSCGNPASGEQATSILGRAPSNRLLEHVPPFVAGVVHK